MQRLAPVNNHSLENLRICSQSTLINLCLFYSLFHCVTVDSQGQMASPVCMACLAPLGHLAVMDVTEPKETRAARERLDPRDQLVQKERKEIRESLEPRVPRAKKDSEERKVRLELQDHLSFSRT